MSEGEQNPSLLDAGQKQTKPAAKKAEAKGESATETVTYLPAEGDRSSVKWAGHVFHANVPKQVDVTKHGELIEAARKNKFFKVGAFDASKDRVPVEETPLPKTSDQYRAWCVAWLAKCESDAEFVDRWMGEEKLREECGVGTDDIDYLNTLILPKRAELKKRTLG